MLSQLACYGWETDTGKSYVRDTTGSKRERREEVGKAHLKAGSMNLIAGSSCYLKNGCMRLKS